MPFLTIAGIEMQMVSFRRRPDELRGEAVRAFNMRLMDGTDAPCRTWEGQTDEMFPDDVDDLRAAVAAGPVICAGLALRGESVLCKVTLTDTPAVWAGEDFAETVSLILVEA